MDLREMKQGLRAYLLALYSTFLERNYSESDAKSAVIDLIIKEFIYFTRHKGESLSYEEAKKHLIPMLELIDKMGDFKMKDNDIELATALQATKTWLQSL